MRILSEVYMYKPTIKSLSPTELLTVFIVHYVIQFFDNNLQV